MNTIYLNRRRRSIFMIDFDPLYYPHPSQRMVVYGHRGMVATSQPLASQAGLSILKQGGNAVDAALAAASTLTVTEPTSNGIGGDAFALIWHKERLYGLNASGAAPASLSIEALRERGHTTMPSYGVLPVTVPGIPGAWAQLSKKMGRLPLTEVLKPAIDYAQDGFPLSPVVSMYWERAFKKYRELKGEEYRDWFQTFAPHGKTPAPGEIWSSPAHAKTLDLIAKTQAKAFYQGELAQRIDAFFKKHDGFLKGEDLEAYSPLWVEPIKTKYRDFHVWELPPNGQGLVTLMALNILEGMEEDLHDEVLSYHYPMEALKLAFTDGRERITDPSYMEVEVEDLLSEEYARRRREEIGERALKPKALPLPGGTVYLATADEEGTMVSYIQSNYMGFGSGLVVPDTGISLQNRGHTFSLDPEEINSLKPGKRTYHTIIPGFLTRGERPIGPFGVMGGFMQPQGHLQILLRTIDNQYNPQAALNAPRWMWGGGRKLFIESSFPDHIAQALLRRGHEVERSLEVGLFGRGQMIWQLPSGVFCGGCEPRADSMVAVW